MFRGPSGGLDEVTLPEDELAGIEVVASSDSPLFDGDPRRFRLGVEAWRIENAFRHDMPGLAVSRISPLPHQLDAVYGTFLEEPVLRFLLADDPGAGKTIMAGLYIKELIAAPSPPPRCCRAASVCSARTARLSSWTSCSATSTACPGSPSSPTPTC